MIKFLAQVIFSEPEIKKKRIAQLINGKSGENQYKRNTCEYLQVQTGLIQNHTTNANLYLL